ncbi:hypothetical protein ABPG75_006963 [Micractinium tetrahymenae]
MFSGGGFAGGGSGEAGGGPARGAATATSGFTGNSAQNHSADQQAAYFGQPAGYQQWLPAQFAQFALRGPYGAPHAQSSNGTVFYAPPPSHGHLAAAAADATGGAGGSGSTEQQAFMAAHAHMQLPMALPPEATAPRGWGGMQLQEQQQQQWGAYGGARVPRGSRDGGLDMRGGSGSGYGFERPGGRPGGRGQARPGGRGRRGRGGHFWEGGTAEDLLMRIKRLPGSAPLDEGVVQGLRFLDSRGLALLIKDLGKANLSHRAVQLFDLIRALGPQHELAALLDEFTFTSMISNCVGQQDLQRALALMEEMRGRGIERNVHTFSALMNVCIKCGQYKLALDVYRDMRAAGCPPNVVTCNTLIDVYGKSGQWEEALDVLGQMKRQGIQPVTRTYNTLMIACNTSNQWQEALRVHDELLASGQPPNTTTFNALISAHSKGGDLAKVLQIFKEMVQRGCERSVITYSSLISACEKAGEWKLALQLFEEMKAEGCMPNVISYNSLITACAQGAQWEKAEEVFEQMQRQGCRPDVVTFTALIQAYERGGQWRRALAAFEEMRSRPCPPDSIVYNAIIDVLWETGVGWAQRRAVALFRQASREGLIRRHSHVCSDSVELNLHSTTAGVALLSLHCWLQDLNERLQAEGAAPLPEKVSIIAGKGKSKDAGQSVIKEVVTALLRSLRAPFKEAADSTAVIGRLEASGAQVTEWLAADGPTVLSAIIAPVGAAAAAAPASPAVATPQVLAEPAATAAGGEGQQGSDNATPEAAAAARAAAGEPSSPAAEAAAGGVPPAQPALAAAAAAAAAAVAGLGRAPSEGSSQDDAAGLEEELSTEARVAEAFKTVKFFEETHCLNLQVMSYGYLQQRPELISLACSIGEQLALPDEMVYDAVLLLDRVMSIPLKAAEGLLGMAMAACLLVAAGQSGLPEAHLPHLASVARVTGVPADLLSQMQANVLAALSNDAASISALRCLKLYLERIGGDTSADAEKANSARSPFRLLHETLADGEFLNYRPSVVAAAVLYVERKSRGMAPYWPTALSTLTGYSLQSTPELAAAVAGAQRLFDKLQVPSAVWSFQPSAPNSKDGSSAAADSAAALAGTQACVGSETAAGSSAPTTPATPAATTMPAASPAPGAPAGLSSSAVAASGQPSAALLLPAVVAAAAAKQAQRIPGSPAAPAGPDAAASAALAAQLAPGLPPAGAVADAVAATAAQLAPGQQPAAPGAGDPAGSL